MKFKSAVDSWFYLLAIGVPAAVMIGFLATADNLASSDAAIVGAVMLVTLALPLWLLFSTYYVVEAEELKIRSGPFKWTIPIKDIHSVKPSRSLLSSPALSLNRLEIQYGRGQTILVSPADLESFKDAIGRRKG